MKHGGSTVNALAVNIECGFLPHHWRLAESTKCLMGLGFGVVAGSRVRGTVTHYGPEV
jgi:hypothetical protein